MISVVKVRYQVLSITSNEYQGKTYHQAQVFNPDSCEAGAIGISDDLAKQIKPDPSKVVCFNAEYNDKFGKLNLKSIDTKEGK